MSNFCILCILCTNTGDKDIWGSRSLYPLISSRIGDKDYMGVQILIPPGIEQNLDQTTEHRPVFCRPFSVL